ncbi:leucine-rich repeat-containing protein kinase family protein [Acidisoma sp. C75]
MSAGEVSLAALRRGDLSGARRLDLAGAGLDTWPAELSALADTLEFLDLSGNPLTALPADLARFRRLRILFLSGTRLRRLPEVLGSCPALAQIGIRAAGLEEIPETALPPRLRWLTVTDNALHRLPAALGARPHLQKLLLSGNQLTALPESLAGATQLELLRLSANRLERLPGWLGTLPRLAWLSWAGNSFGPASHLPAEPPIAWARLRPDPQASGPLGEGASGTVQAMRLRPTGAAVAVKLFKGRMTSDGLPGQEMAAMLAAGRHPHLLSALGAVRGHPEGAEALVMPRLSPDARPLAAPPSLDSCTRDIYPPGSRFTLGMLRTIARGVASATGHLHAAGLSHGDLYAHNILWDGQRPILSDFGAASRLPSGPEAAALAGIDRRAFGILIAELLDRCSQAGEVPGLAGLAAACQAPAGAGAPAMAEIERLLSAV